MTTRQQAMWWGVAALGFILFMWIFSPILAPFVIGAGLAYFTDPLADRVQKLGASRLLATAVVMGGAFTTFVLLLLAVGPLVVDQAQRLSSNLPQYIDTIRNALDKALVWFDLRIGATGAEGGQSVGAQLGDAAKDFGIGALKRLLAGGLALANLLGVLFITPVVAFYLLLDWDNIVARIDSWLPRAHVEEIRGIASDIDGVMAGFLRGQVMVCMILGTFYATALSLVGLDLGLVVGLISGLICFIPFVGSLVGLILSVGLAFVQFSGDWLMIGVVAGIFVFGQLVEGNLLTPYLVGGNVGLHPVWLIFALSAFGLLFGFAGLVIAVPAAAAVGVLARWGLERYKQSRLYGGEEA